MITDPVERGTGKRKIGFRALPGIANNKINNCRTGKVQSAQTSYCFRVVAMTGVPPWGCLLVFRPFSA